MTKEQPRLVLTDDAEMALSSLGDDDRRRVSAVLNNHLQFGRDDEFVRTHSVHVATLDDHYSLQWSDWLVFFRLSDGVVTVLSIHRRDILKAFQAAAQATR